MRRQCTHLTSQARGDILVRTNELVITDRVQGHGSARKQFVIDVKTVAMVDGNGVWDERWNPATSHHDNPGLLTAEQTKYRKHEAQYAQTGHSFVAFVCSCFGALGPSAIRYLWVLAMLELRQHEALRHAQGLRAVPSQLLSIQLCSGCCCYGEGRCYENDWYPLSAYRSSCSEPTPCAQPSGALRYSQSWSAPPASLSPIPPPIPPSPSPLAAKRCFSPR